MHFVFCSVYTIRKGSTIVPISIRKSVVQITRKRTAFQPVVAITVNCRNTKPYKKDGNRDDCRPNYLFYAFSTLSMIRKGSTKAPTSTRKSAAQITRKRPAAQPVAAKTAKQRIIGL